MTKIRAVVLLFALLLSSLSFAETIACASATELTKSLCDVYCTLNGLIPIMAFTLVMLSAVAYGIGNFFGSEVRAKANAWAMSCLTGAIIALLIITFSNVIINNMIGSYTITC
jgi:ABC-type multidrug transport system permease subunit